LNNPSGAPPDDISTLNGTWGPTYCKGRARSTRHSAADGKTAARGLKTLGFRDYDKGEAPGYWPPLITYVDAQERGSS